MTTLTPSQEALDRFAARLQAFYDALPADEQPLMQTVLREAGQPVTAAEVEGFQLPTFQTFRGGGGFFWGNVGVGGWRGGGGGYLNGRVGLILQF